MKQVYKSILLVLFCLSLFATIQANILHVKPGAGSSAWQGKSNVYSDLQAALADAVSGDQIWVAGGIYKPTTGTDRTISFQLKDGVELYGGFAGTETELSQRNWRLNETILSGDIGVVGVDSDNSYNVLRVVGSEGNPITNTTIIDGVIVEGGYADLSSNENIHCGGLYLNNASPVVRNVWFRHNLVRKDGAAIYVVNSSSVALGNIIFSNNRSFEGSIISSRDSDIKLHNCLFYSNRSWNSNTYGSSTSFTVSNSISWNNDIRGSNTQFWSTTVSYSLVQGGHYGVGNINADPLLIDPENRDFRLAMNSPAIGAGNSEIVPDWIMTDFDGKPRVGNGTVNMGLFESFAITPEVIAPNDKAQFASNISEVLASWQLQGNDNEEFVNYSIEYIKNSDILIRVDDIAGLTYLFDGLTATDVIEWRVAGVTIEGYKNWTQWRVFNVKRAHPLHVTVDGTGSGTSWADAMSLQEALSIAKSSDQIWVAAGTYKPTEGTNRSISFKLKDGVELYGGFAGTETALIQRNLRMNKSILSGDIGEEDVATDNSYHVLEAIGTELNPIGNSTIIDGFIVQDGYANILGSANGNGGGMYLRFASPIVRNIWFRGNYARTGGAVYGNQSTAVFGNVVFTNNISELFGAAAYSYYAFLKFYNCLFYDNVCNRNAGIVNGSGSASKAEVINSIAWNKGLMDATTQFSHVSVSHSLVLGGYTGVGNIDANPLLTDPVNGDFRLSMNSPALGAGNIESAPDWLITDFDGAPRITDGRINMGPVERFALVPELVFPDNKAQLNSDLEDVLVTWQDPGDESGKFLSYSIEYVKNDDDLVRVDEIVNPSYLFEHVSATDIFQWRVAGITQEGHRKLSEWRTFSIKRAQPLHVKADGTGDGTSWQDAISLQEALSVAIYGDQIWVAAGIYKPTQGADRTLSFVIKEGIQLYGGFAGNETELNQRNWVVNKTILSGDIGDSDFYEDNSYHVLRAVGTQLIPITNNTILDGFIVERGYADGGSDSNDYGGGIYLDFASPIIKNVWFRDNYATNSGGAVYGINSSVAEFGNVMFTHNKAEQNGGAASSTSSAMKFYNCLFYGNYAGGWGGAIRPLNTINEIEVINSIAWNNVSIRGGGQFLYVSVRHTLHQSSFSGNGNISADPLFVDPENGDFRLSKNSPALNMGNSTLVPLWLETDFVNYPRISDGEINMGPYQSFASKPFLNSPYDNALLESVQNNVELSWEFPDDATETITSYSIEYRKNNEIISIIEGVDNSFYNLDNLVGSDIIQWRVGAITNCGYTNWSEWRSFRILRTQPLFVTTEGSGNGTSWQDAMSLQEALSIVAPGEKIWVAAGIYKPTTDINRTISFELKDGIELYGGFAGNETSLDERNWRLNKTILSGNIGDVDVDTDNSYHVLTAIGTELNPISNSTIFDGFIVERGHANLSSNNNNNGGGLYLSYASPTIRNVWFRDNNASYRGGAVYGMDLSSVRFGNVLFTNNRSIENGGAVYTRNSIMQFINCLFYGNHSENLGGAVYSDSSDNGAEIINSISWENSARVFSQFRYVTVSNSIVQGGYTGTDNINQDPLFIAVDSYDFRLLMDSPGLNAGNSEFASEWLTHDFAGNLRITDGQINIGLFEGSNYVPIPISPLDNTLLDSDVSEVELSWQVPEESPVEFTEFIIEYVKNDEEAILTQNMDQLTYILDEINPFDYIKWRVAGIAASGDHNWSEWRSFRIKRSHPLYVQTDGEGDGTSWLDAMNLHEALLTAIEGDQIWVAAGIYKPTNDDDRAISFELKEGIELYGGFNGDETQLSQRNWRKNKTILSGNIGEHGLDIDNSYNVLTAIGSSSNPFSNFTVFDGFIVEGGYANGEALRNQQGGGLYLSHASVIISNVWFRHNFSGRGGAIYVGNAPAVACGNVIFSNNRVERDDHGYGGAVYSISSAMEFHNCLFYSNVADGIGGALFNATTTSGVKLINSIVWNNQARIAGQIYNLSVANTIVQGGYAGDGNIDANPLIINPEEGDFRLLMNSPALNTGNPELVADWLIMDFGGHSRFTDEALNIGPFEGLAVVPTIISPDDGLLLDSGITEVLVSWELPEGILDYFVDYSIEYVVNDAASIQVNNIESLNYLIEGINGADLIEWRVAGVTIDNYVNWSDWSRFLVKRSHPLYVTVDGQGDGTSWQDPMNLQEALATSITGDQIWVATGVYKPTEDDDRTVSFVLKDGVKLYGGFTGDETELDQRNWRLNPTILSGDIGEAGNDTDNSYHVLTAIGSSTDPISNSTVFDGFIVEGGYADLSSGNNNRGGGLFLDHALPVIRNVWFRDNYAADNGGAVYGLNSSSAFYGNVLFTNNRADRGGGAVYSWGSAMQFQNCLFYENYSGFWGGAIGSDFSGSGVVVINSIAWNNTASGGGSQFSNVSVTHSLIQNGYSGTGNINRDPLFNEPGNFDFRLDENSPAVNAGNPELLSEFLTRDFAGKTRVTSGEINMGLYEGVVFVPVPVTPINNALIDSDISEVELSWKVPEDSPVEFVEFLIEYIKNDEVGVFTENIEQYTYILDELNPFDNIQWRVAGITPEGLLNWSEWRTFRLKRAHPLYVTQDATANGTSWQNAMNLQEALSVAVFGDQIWVASGIYKPTNDDDRTISFELKDGVELYGGFVGIETELSQRNWRLNETILSGDIGEVGVFTDNSYQVISARRSEDNPITSFTIVDGFIVEGGYADGESWINNRGGALNLNHASPLIRNIWFRYNYSTSMGGAVYAGNSSQALFGNVIFTDNSTNGDGGAVYTISSQMYFFNSIFYHNSSRTGGGAISNSSYGNGGKVFNSILWNNFSNAEFNQAWNAQINHSIVQGGYAGIGNIDSTPELIDAVNSDFRLSMNSPALNAGNIEHIPEWLVLDYAGNSRITDGQLNIGLYEDFVYTPVLVAPANNALINRGATEVDLVWELPEGSNDEFIEFLIEYVKSDGESVVIENALQLSYLFDIGDIYGNIQWRVAGKTSEGISNWSQWSTFTLHRQHPLYVTEEGNGGGSSWQNAMSLQDALSTAVFGDQIWVAAGVYKPTDGTDRTISFQLKEGVELYGGFAGTETELSQRNWRLNKSILSGDIGEAGVNTDNSYHVLTASGSFFNSITNSTILDGFIVEGGYADLSSNSYNNGGGLLLRYASPIIRNVWFRQNFASNRGGAIYGTNSSNALLGNAILSQNKSDDYGGAVFTLNSEMRFHNCVFYDNYSNEWGGAVFSINSNAEVINSIAWGNKARVAHAQFSQITVNSSLVQGGYSGSGNINSDPLFANPDNGDFRLMNISPAIGVGNSILIPEWLILDYSGNSRITDGKINMGIYEGFAIAPVLIAPIDNVLFESNVHEAELSWQMPEDNSEVIVGYQLEYIKNKGNSVIIEDLDVTTYTIDGLLSADLIQWRVAAITIDGLFNWSAWNSFSIKRDQPIYVTTDGNGWGAGWYDAMSLQNALTIAISGDEIWVAAGIYKPTDGTDRTISFQLKDGVELYGGFAGNETELSQRNWRVNETILSGDIGEVDVDNDNSYHVITAVGTEANPISDATILDGIIVEGGYANFRSNNNDKGGGLFLSYASPIVRNVWFRNNFSDDDGGAVYGLNSSSAVFGNILFTNNEANDDGGAVYSMNSAMRFYNSLFYNNYSNYWGGAICSNNVSSGVEIINSIAWNNDARVGNSQFRNVFVSNSIVQGGFTGTGNIDTDPLFMDSDNGNFMLKPGSPAIDAGNRDLLPDFLTTDYLGLVRVQGNDVDMGPFESLIVVNTMPSNHAGARESAFLGLEFRWGLKVGHGNDESIIPGMQYRIKVWESNDEINPLFDTVITPGGFMPAQVNRTSLFGFNTGATYHWQIAMLLDGMEIWSEPTVFYVGHDHVIHVKEGNEGVNGASWSDAFGTIHEALEFALPGDEIWVASGTYYPVEVSNPSSISAAERETALQLKTGISIYGGFGGTEVSRNHRNYWANQTIISGDLSGNGSYANSSINLFKNTGTEERPIEVGAILDGFIFEHAAQSAIVNKNASPSIRNSVFRNNQGINGGAISNHDGSSPFFYHVLFHKNSADNGGAVWSDETSLPEFIHVTVGDNSASEIGGLYGPSLVKNSIVYHNEGGQLSDVAEVLYSCIEGGFEGVGNRAHDPMWVDMNNGNFNLRPFSSAIDGGSQMLMPEMPVYDLGMQGRLMHNTVDMGAYEAQDKGRLEMESNSVDQGDQYFKDSIKLIFNQTIEIANPEIIQLSSDEFDVALTVTSEDNMVIISHDGLLFDSDYRLNIPAGAIAFIGNETILNRNLEIAFKTLVCNPVVITDFANEIEVCPYGSIEIEVQTTGDVLSYRWIFNDEELSDAQEQLFIESVTPDQFGVYTLVIEDYCSIGTSQQFELKSVEITQLNVLDKWGTIFFVDNSQNQLSDFEWYLNGNYLSGSQFVDMSRTHGKLLLHAFDQISGCILRSEEIDVISGHRTGLVFWPNPVVAGNSVTVMLPTEFEPVSVRLYDISGRLMVNEKAPSGAMVNFDKTDFLPGVYILQFEDESGRMEFDRITID
ncbi:choice-of-anchor Q domain-containing protein [Natronoflexus pectinivorans]|uniref:Putative outer membrane repeat protein n=1 Tax=Natronoflexus pectinivorans TaxID=682526 RepID=A0A4R2GHQ1_9BACT|nr:choice-of-anchor Q domain-containing protein [Natronoflexus pectinivorans]TCO07764.1 putative outer membrane repeat protein [Natronoflexus pectinivorans]